MDKHILKNGDLEIAVLEKGAELCSMKLDNTEFIWDRNPDFWAKSSPVLFPFVGVLKDGKYSYKNKEYNLTTRHGFARDKNFEFVEKTDNELLFLLSSDKDTLELYPFYFDLYIKYVIKNNALNIEYIVENKSDDVMYFSLGTHPAFMTPTDNETKLEDYYLEFSNSETLGMTILENNLVIEKKIPYLNNDKIINLGGNVFDNDAIIFEGLKSKEVTLKCKKNTREVKVNYDGFPYVAFWGMKDAQFVCIEPWYGIADYSDTSGKLEEKKGIVKISKNSKFSATLGIEVIK